MTGVSILQLHSLTYQPVEANQIHIRIRCSLYSVHSEYPNITIFSVCVICVGMSEHNRFVYGREVQATQWAKHQGWTLDSHVVVAGAVPDLK